MFGNMFEGLTGVFRNLTDSAQALLNNSNNMKDLKEAENVVNQMRYPSFAALLPYRYYDEENELFINHGSIGFGFEIGGITGGNDTVANGINDVIRRKIPKGSRVSVILYSDKQVEGLLDSGMKKVWWGGENTKVLDQVTRNYYKQAILEGFPNQRQYPLTLRDYRVMLFVSKKKKYNRANVTKLVAERREIVSALKASMLEARNISLQYFINSVGAMINHDASRTKPFRKKWKPLTEINQQVVNADFGMEVEENHLIVTVNDDKGQKQESFVTVLSQNDTPDYFALWMGPESYKSLFDPVMGINCPFLINLTFEVEDRVKVQQEAGRKYLRQDKNSNFNLAKFIPRMRESANEWRDIRDALVKDETSLCCYTMSVVLFSSGDERSRLRDVNNAIASFRRNEIEMHIPPYQQLPLFLHSLPFGGGEGFWDDLKYMGSKERAKSENVASLFPVITDTKLCPEGLLIPTYRNQVAFFDPFNSNMGQSNYNMAFAGVSGGGKSVCFQAVCRDVLSRNGMVWIADLGDSYKNFCMLAGGQYLSEKDIRFNPFADVINIADSAEPIRDFLAVLASPKGYLDDVHRAELLDAVKKAWDSKGRDTKIDHVIGVLSERLKNDPDSRLKEIISLLANYATTGVNGHYFNANHDELQDRRFTVLELGNLKDKPDLLSGVLFAFAMKVQAKMYDDRYATVPKICGIDEAWQYLTKDNSGFADFISGGTRTVRKHLGSFAVITQGIDDFYSTPQSKAIWTNSGIKFVLLQDSQAFSSFVEANPNQISSIEAKVIKSFEAAKTNHFSSLMLKINNHTSFHRLFMDPISRVMTANSPEDRVYIKQRKEEGVPLEQILWDRAAQLYPREMEVLVNV